MQIHMCLRSPAAATLIFFYNNFRILVENYKKELSEEIIQQKILNNESI